MKTAKKILILLLSFSFVFYSIPDIFALEEEVTTQHEHSYSSQVLTELTHVEDGIVRYTCSCGDTYDEVTEALGHSYTSQVITSQTHTQSGLIRYTCSCGDTYDEATEALGHSYTALVIIPQTHTQSGLIRYTCICGDTYDEVAEALGHDYVPQVIIELTHTQNGLIRYICSCGDFYEEITFSKGHSYTSGVVKRPGHTVDGVMGYTCSCGDYYEEIIEAEGHTYEYKLILPTCTDNGREVEVCKVCGDEIVLRCPETDETATDLLALGHDYVITEHTEPTQDEDGYTVYECSVCRDTYTAVKEHDDKYVAEMFICTRRQISPAGHMWVYFQNKSNHELQVGAYTVPAGQGVSVGVFALTKADGFGIYYNVEAYCANKYGLNSVICMREKLTASELEKVSKRVANSNFWDLIIFNCMGQAFSIWNSGSNAKLIPLIFPVFGRLQILLHKHETDIDMYYPTENQVFKQRGLGKNATLDKVSRYSLANGV